ncbi:MAG: DegT/DnrJ/EryC1/StrS family aminotransferase [Aeriscardovia sp.]|nr:DegT/DnrJ/EryC1/StrS family aminotransferase [Aeriscardovia sp.]
MIQQRRKEIWQAYYDGLRPLMERGYFEMPDVPDYATNNAHMFYLVCRNLDERTRLINYLKKHDVLAVFHYLSLHLSDYYRSVEKEIPSLPNCDRFADCLIRLPLFFELKDEEVTQIAKNISDFYAKL